MLSSQYGDMELGDKGPRVISALNSGVCVMSPKQICVKLWLWAGKFANAEADNVCQGKENLASAGNFWSNAFILHLRKLSSEEKSELPKLWLTGPGLEPLSLRPPFLCSVWQPY